MKIVERLKLETITPFYYSCNFSKIENDIIIDFVDKKIEFKSCLTTKCGYPNEEIYMHYDYYTKEEMRKNCLYEIENSNWIKELKEMNKVHARHNDELFKRDRHFIILFEDEVFECIASTFRIIEK